MHVNHVAEDPLRIISRARTWLHTRWIKSTYPFERFGHGTSIDYSCDIRRTAANAISIGEFVYLAPDIWLNVAELAESEGAKIVLGSGCRIGRRTTISAKNLIRLEDDVLTAPSVLLMDHNHSYEDIKRPIHTQGVTSGGTITIGRNSWLGYGVVILSGQRDLVIGQNSIVAANAVVNQSFPDFSMIGGNPAKLLRAFDPDTERWVKP